MYVDIEWWKVIIDHIHPVANLISSSSLHCSIYILARNIYRIDVRIPKYMDDRPILTLRYQSYKVILCIMIYTISRNLIYIYACDSWFDELKHALGIRNESCSICRSRNLTTPSITTGTGAMQSYCYTTTSGQYWGRTSRTIIITS